MSTRFRKSEDAWCGELPDWVTALVAACDATSQNKVAKQMGYSSAVISLVLNNTYTGDMDKIEKNVRDFFMSGVDCPALGKITADQCLAWRNAGKEPNPSSPHKSRMFRACRICPRSGKHGPEGVSK
jgi:hypothetical protein